MLDTSGINSENFIVFIIIAFIISLIATVAITFTVLKKTRANNTKGEAIKEEKESSSFASPDEPEEETYIPQAAPESNFTPPVTEEKAETDTPQSYTVNGNHRVEHINTSAFNINDLKKAMEKNSVKDKKPAIDEIEWSSPVSRVSKTELEEIELKKAISDIKNNKPIPAAARNKNDTGVEFVRKGELLKAIPNYIEATELAPHYTLAFYNLGNAYFEIGDQDKAIKNYERVITLNPKDEFAYYNLASCYYKKGDLKEATRYYQQAVEISPGDVVTHYNLGKVYEQLSDIEKAIEAYKKAISINQKYANAHYNLAELLKYKGLYRQAIQEYQLYLKYNPDAEDEMEVKKIIVSLMAK